LISTVTAIYDIGCFFGAILVCAIGDPLGRKNCVLLGTTIMSIGAIIQIASFNVPEMIVGRLEDTKILNAVAKIRFQNHCRNRKRHQHINRSVILYHCLSSSSQGETSKASWRGKLIIIEMIMNIAGFSLSNWVTYGFS
jgi:MFS family permease